MSVGGQRHAPAALAPGMTRYSLYRKLGGPLWLGDCLKICRTDFSCVCISLIRQPLRWSSVGYLSGRRSSKDRRPIDTADDRSLHRIFGLLMEGLRLRCSTASQFTLNNKHIYLIAPETPSNMYQARIAIKMKLMHTIKYWRGGLRQ
jgi:hypothetical protein